MKKRRRTRRGISLGTVVMLTLTSLVLVGFLALLPSFTGHQDIRIDAARLVVAMDESFTQLAAASSELMQSQPQSTILPPESLATAVPPYAAALAQATPTPRPTATPVPKLSFSLCAAGSVQMNSSMHNAMKFDDEYRFDILTDQVAGALSADLSIATLEHTLVSSNKTDNLNMPADVLKAFTQAGVNTLNIGFPDVLNHGLQGLSDTAQAIREAGLRPIGAYASEDEYASSVMLDLNGCRVAVLHYQDDVSATGRKKTTEEERAAAIRPITLDGIASDISLVRQYGAQVVLVSLCWGKEGASQPTDEQKTLAQGLADAGADIILGTHSGVLQPVSLFSANRGDGRYHPVLCAYSLGNLYSYQREKRTTLSSILLKTEVIYDPITGCVAFEDLAYTPTYAWRGKSDGRYYYRVLLNDNQTYPDFVNKEQQGVMERCYTLVADVMADTGIEEAFN